VHEGSIILFPMADYPDTPSQQWDPTGCTSHYDCINDGNIDDPENLDLSNYLRGSPSTSGEQDEFEMTNIPGGPGFPDEIQVNKITVHDFCALGNHPPDRSSRIFFGNSYHSWTNIGCSDQGNWAIQEWGVSGGKTDVNNLRVAITAAQPPIIGGAVFIRSMYVQVDYTY